MNDDKRSGNRWEPTDPDITAPLNATPSSSASNPVPAGTATAELDRPTEPADDQHTVPAGYAAPTEPAAGSWRDRLGPLRTKSAAFAAATFLVGGAGGFALGHAVASNGEQAGQQGQFTPGQRPDGFGRGGGDGDGRGFDGDGGPQQGQQNGQQAPNQDGAQQGTTSGSTT